MNICFSFSESLSYPRRYPRSVLLEETEDCSSMRYESIMKEMDYHKPPNTATNMDRLNALKKVYMDYVSSVYPRWVEEVALYKERKRIIGDQASLHADLTTGTHTQITTDTNTNITTGTHTQITTGTNTNITTGTNTNITTGTNTNITTGTSTGTSAKITVGQDGASTVVGPLTTLVSSGVTQSQSSLLPLAHPLTNATPMLHSSSLVIKRSSMNDSLDLSFSPSATLTSSTSTQLEGEDLSHHMADDDGSVASSPVSSGHRVLPRSSAREPSPPAMPVVPHPSHLSSEEEEDDLLQGDHSQHMQEVNQGYKADGNVLEIESMLSGLEEDLLDKSDPLTVTITSPHDQQNLSGVPELTILDFVPPLDSNESINPQQDPQHRPPHKPQHQPSHEPQHQPSQEPQHQLSQNISPTPSSSETPAEVDSEEVKKLSIADQKPTGSTDPLRGTSIQSEEDTGSSFWDSDHEELPASSVAIETDKNKEIVEKKQEAEENETAANPSNKPKSHSPGGSLVASLLKQVDEMSDSQTETGNESLDLPRMENGNTNLMDSAEYQKLVSGLHSGKGEVEAKGDEEESLHSSLFSESSAVKVMEQEIRKSVTPEGGKTDNVQVLKKQGLPGTLQKANPQELISGCDHDLSSSTASEVLSPTRYMPSMLQQDSGKVKVGGKDVLDKSLSFSASLKKKGFWEDSDTDSDVDVPVLTPGGGGSAGSGKQNDDDDFDFYA